MTQAPDTFLPSALHELLSTTSASDQRVETELESIRDVMLSFGFERPLLVVCTDALDAAGVGDELASVLEGFAVRTFDAFTPNPKSTEALACGREALEHDADVIIGIGGGSCLDVAKLGALAARQGESAEAVITGEQAAERSPIPIIAAPTTTGTGAEVTPFSAIYVDGKKKSVGHADLRPIAAILEARFARCMPPKLVAETGLDALCQAMESLWAVGSTPISMDAAGQALRLLAPSLAPAVHGDADARLDVQIGSHLAGRAIAISKTTASHAMSYELTQRFGLAHGHAVALTIGALASYNASVRLDDCLDPRGHVHVRDAVRAACAPLGVEPAQAPAAMRELFESIGLPSSLSECNVARTDLEELANAADVVRLSNNPRRLRTSDVFDIYRTSLG